MLEQHAENQRKAGVIAQPVHDFKIEDVVDLFSQYVTEWNVNYGDNGEAERVNQGVPPVASQTNEGMLQLLEDGQEEARHAYYERLVRSEHLHDFHYPEPTGPPNPFLALRTTGERHARCGIARTVTRETSSASPATRAWRRTQRVKTSGVAIYAATSRS